MGHDYYPRTVALDSFPRLSRVLFFAVAEFVVALAVAFYSLLWSVSCHDALNGLFSGLHSCCRGKFLRIGDKRSTT